MARRLVAGVICVVLGGCVTLNPPSAPSPQQPRLAEWTFDPKEFLVFPEDYPRDGVVLGQGWDAFLGRKTPAVCVQGRSEKLTGQSATISFTEVRDRENLFSAMSMSASAKFSAVAVSGGGSVEFSRSVQFDSEALNILASARADKGGSHLVPEGRSAEEGVVRYGLLRLTDETRALLSTESGRRDFLRRCGDAFVISVRRGGRLDALFRYSLKTTDERERLKASASGSWMGGSASANFESETKKLTSEGRTSMNFSQIGGSLATLPLSAEELLAKLKAWAGFAQEDAEPYVVYLMSYRNLDTWPSGTPLGMPSRELQDYGSHYWRLVDLSSRYVEASAAPQRAYNLFDRNNAADADLMRAAASCIDAAIAACARDRSCSIEGLGHNMRYAVRCEAFDRRTAFSQKDRDVIIAAAFSQTAGAMKLKEIVKRVDTVWKDQDRATTVDTPRLTHAFDQDRPTKTAFWNYYKWLAVSPLARTVPPTSGDESDERDGLNAIIAISKTKTVYCDGIRVCTVLTRAGLHDFENQTQQFKDDAEKLAREWVLNHRLKPLSETFCRVHVRHPMCFSNLELAAIAKDVPVRFAKLNVGIPPAPMPPPSEPRPPYPIDEDPCYKFGTYTC